MPTYSAKALVLKKTKLGETDLIITMLSDEGKQIRAVAKGARKPASRFSASLELFSEVDVLLYTGRNLDTVTEAHVCTSNGACRADLEHSSGAAVLAEVLEKITGDGVEEPILYPFACIALNALGAASVGRIPLLVSAILLKIASIIGFRPSIGICALCGNEASGAYFSSLAGGALCDTCFAQGVSGGLDPWDASSVEWAGVLIGSTFDQLCALEMDDVEALSLGMNELRLAKTWTDTHLGLRLKSLDFLFSSGLF